MTVTQPGWVDHAIWWHCFPLGFTGAEPTAVREVHHRFEHLVAWFDYVIEVGCNGILLGPIFASESHGYDTTDHYRIDPRLGDEDDFRRFLAAAHDKGIRVVLDGVFNHVGWSHPWAGAGREAGPGTPEGDRLKWAGEYVNCFEGSMNLPELNLTNPEVRDHVTAVMNHWLDMGVDGWRLDAAYAPGADTWAPITAAVRERHPEAYLLGEVIHGDYPDFVQRSGVHAVTQYELWKAVWSSMNDTNFWELSHALERHQEFTQVFIPYTFIGNHDVTRIATQLADPRHIGHATALLALLPGVPSVYYGDEQAYAGTKEEREGGDSEVRPPMPAHPSELSDLGAATHELYQRLLGVRRRFNWLVRATTDVVAVTNETLLIELTAPSGEGSLALALNIDDEPKPMPAGDIVTASGQDTTHVEPHGWAVLQR